jgi:hypothetical protein
MNTTPLNLFFGGAAEHGRLVFKGNRRAAEKQMESAECIESINRSRSSGAAIAGAMG